MANYSADDVRDFLVDNRELLNDHLEHYGLPRRSGRYKWGSGKDPYQSIGRKHPFKKSVAAGERFIKSKFSSKKRTQRKMEKRKAKEEAEVKSKEKYRNEKEYVKSLSDDELRKINTRDTAEAAYLRNHPQKKSIGKKMIDMAFKDIIVPAVNDTIKDEGKKYVKKQLKELMAAVNSSTVKKKK